MDLLCPLVSDRCTGNDQERIKDCYFKKSDRILDGAEPFCSVILEASGSWIFFCVCAQSMWTYNEAGISSWRRHSSLNDYNRMALSFLTKLNFWRRKLYRIWLDSFLHLGTVQ